PHWVIEKVKAKAARFKSPVIGCLGLTFKADIDDMRESPAFDIVKELMAQQAGEILVCDPNVQPEKVSFPLSPLKKVLKDADILLLLVDHHEFKEIDPDTIRDKVVIDTRGALR
ncbi:UDP binding domain-containing protein, partial [Hydrogenophaga sp.]|uniref:UDP binding domain-containing protein n=1 Tax=Hydrogenophaga sp. TaxID=1904254 RepID=UPI0035646B23